MFARPDTAIAGDTDVAAATKKGSPIAVVAAATNEGSSIAYQTSSTSTTTEDMTFATSAAIATTTDITEECKNRMLLEMEAMIAKNAKTTMTEIDNAATMTGTPIAATSPSGSVADHDSSKFVAENDLGQTTKGNKKVSIISDMFLFPKWN